MGPRREVGGGIGVEKIKIHFIHAGYFQKTKVHIKFVKHSGKHEVKTINSFLHVFKNPKFSSKES